MIFRCKVNESKATFSNDGKVIRFGLGGIKYVGSVAETIIKERGEGYTSYANFLARIKPNKRVIESLIKSGSLDQFEGTRQAKLSYVEDTVRFIKTIKKRAQKEKSLWTEKHSDPRGRARWRSQLKYRKRGRNAGDGHRAVLKRNFAIRTATFALTL